MPAHAVIRARCGACLELVGGSRIVLGFDFFFFDHMFQDRLGPSVPGPAFADQGGLAWDHPGPSVPESGGFA